MASQQPAEGAREALLLVVERDPTVRRLERFFLEDAGFRVELAEDGLDGLNRARALRPAIVITEVMLQRVDGLSVCRALKAEPSTSDVSVLVLSVLAAEERALEAGADAFLRKPIDDGLLIGTVRRLLAQGREGQATA
jgi:DNA-binding response OmpR family regulator